MALAPAGWAAGDDAQAAAAAAAANAAERQHAWVQAACAVQLDGAGNVLTGIPQLLAAAVERMVETAAIEDAMHPRPLQPTRLHGCRPPGVWGWSGLKCWVLMYIAAGMQGLEVAGRGCMQERRAGWGCRQAGAKPLLRAVSIVCRVPHALLPTHPLLCRLQASAWRRTPRACCATASAPPCASWPRLPTWRGCTAATAAHAAAPCVWMLSPPTASWLWGWWWPPSFSTTR